MKRLPVCFLCFSIFFFLLVGEGSRSSAASVRTSNFAASITGESMAAVWIAKDRDIFRKYGLDVRFIQMPKSSVSVAALIAGEIDMAIIGPGHLLNAASGGADVVGVGNLVQNLNYRFVSRPEIKTPEDLRGKRVAISGPGSVSHIIALLALQRLSMDPDQAKISFITIPGTELNRRIALETKNVDASSLLGSVGDLYIKRGYTMLFNFKAAGLTMPQTVLAVTRRTLAAKPEVFDSYLKGFVEAIAYILEPANKSTVMGIIASNLRLDSPAAAEEGYKNVVSSYERIPHLHPEGMKMLHKVLGSLNPKLVNVRPESTVETAPLTRLERSGFVESVYKKP